jgi:hypothetical protein
MNQQPAGTGLTIASRKWEAAQAAARAAYSAACFEADQIRDRAYYASTLRTGAAMPSDADMRDADDAYAVTVDRAGVVEADALDAADDAYDRANCAAVARAAYHACYADAYARAIQTGGTIARCRANAEYEATNAAARAVAAIVEEGGEA